MQKPYKSLQDVYIAETFAKIIPPLPRQTILGEEIKKGSIQNYGNKDIQFHLPGIEPEEGRTFPKSGQEQLLKKKIGKGKQRHVTYEIPGEEKKGEAELVSIAMSIFNGKGQGIEDAASVMVSKLRTMFYSGNHEEEFKAVKSTLVALSYPPNKIKSLPPEGRFNIVDVIFKETGGRYSKSLINMLLNISGKGSTNLGRVELGITVFYNNAKKATKGGDVEIQNSAVNGVQLDINSITYELKGDGGRMGDGDDGFAIMNLEAYMNSFYKKHNTNKEYGRLKVDRSKVLIENLLFSVKEILDVPDSTVLEIFELILKGTPKPETPQHVISDFYAASESFKKEQINDATVKLLSTALQMQTYRETDGHKFQNFFAYRENFDAYIVNVVDFNYIKYYNMLAENFDVTRPASDGKYKTFGITLKK